MEYLKELILILMAGVLINNYVLQKFLGICPFLGVSKKFQQAAGMGVAPYVLYFGLLVGATLGGNITPIGASANITGIGILRKEGYTVKNSDFLKIGIPFTLAAIIPAYVYLWLFYGM